MNPMKIQIEVTTISGKHELTKELPFNENDTEALLPIPQEGDAGWAYFNMADEIASKIVAEELFQNHFALKENSKDLRDLGVTYLKAIFSSSHLNRSNTVLFIA